MQNDTSSVLTQVIKLQSVILGPDTAIRIAKGIGGFSIDDAGNVTAISGNGEQLLQKVIEKFSDFSGGQILDSLK
ncbi:MAG: hypothetical protein AAB974_01055 [Patescibacteria group bacterium]